MARLRYIAAGMLLVGSIIVGLMVYSIGAGEIASVIAKASLVFLGAYILASVGIAAIATYKWQLILRSQRIRIPYNRLFMYRMIGYSVSYLTPTAHVGSEPIRAYLLKREGIHTNKAFSTVIIDKSLELIADVLFFFFGALLIINSVAVNSRMKLIVLIISLILILLMGMFVGGVLGKRSMFIAIFRFLRLHRMRKLRPIQRNLGAIEKQIESFYRKEKRLFVIIMGLMVLLWGLMFLEYKFLLLMLGVDASLVQIFLILTGVGLAYAVPVPAAMGTLELGQLSAAKVLALGSATGIALAFIVRARDLVWTAIGLVFLTIYQFSFSRLAKETKRIDKEFEKGDIEERM
jgi:uncharacterized protein (TIRG00374 family)